MPELPAPFYDHLRAIVERVTMKNDKFIARVTALREHYGGGSHLARDIEQLTAQDRYFCERLLNYDWQTFASDTIAQVIAYWQQYRQQNQNAQRIYWCWNDIDTSFRIQATTTQKMTLVARHRRAAGLAFESFYERLLFFDDHQVYAYPIIFTHDMDANRRAILSSLLIWVLQWSVAMCRAQQDDDKFDGTMVFLYEELMHEYEITCQSNRIVAVRVPGLNELGWQPEREIERWLSDYSRLDPQAHLTTLMMLNPVAEVESIDFIEPTGKACQIVLEREKGSLIIRRRDKPEIVRKRMHRFIDPSTVDEDIQLYETAPQLNDAFNAILKSLVFNGYRCVYRRSCVDGKVVEDGTFPLQWDKLQP